MKKKLLFFVATLLMLGQSAFAYDFSAVAPSGQTLFYKIIDPVNHYVKVTYPNDDQIPEESALGHSGPGELWFPYSMPLGSLIIPDTVSHNGITYTVRAIGSFAFVDYPYLTSVVMPNTIDSIGRFAFHDCVNLSNITFSNILRYIGEHSLSGCYLGDVVLPPSVRVIEGNAFYNSHITNITMNDSIEILGDDCFNENLFASLYIPASVNSVSNPCRFMVNLTSIVVDPNNPYYDSRDNCNAIIKTAENKLVQGCNGTTIPNGVVSFDLYPFMGCSFETLVMPSSVITMDCFSGCHYINKLVISSPLIGCPGGGDTIQFLCQTPPNVLESTLERFNETGIYGKPIIVPCGTLSAYQSAPVWSNCTNIMEYEAPQITVNAAEHGSAAVVSQPTCTSDTATVSATATEEHYHFVGWSDGSTENPYTLVLSGNTTLTALFAIDSATVTVTSADAGKGSVMGGGVIPLGGSATVTAVPTGDNIFLTWSNGVTTNPYTFTVTSDITLTAQFTLPDTIVLHDTTYVPVHDTTYIDVHDTTFVPVHDTTYVPVHDTTYVPVYAVEYVDRYIHDTAFVNTYVHDTTIQYVNNYVFDTTHINNYVHDTTIQYVNNYVYDTTYINNYIHDTTVLYVNQYVYDTTFINNYLHDTIILYVNHYVHDTTYINNYLHDTITMTTQMFDTTIVNLYQFDTSVYNNYNYDTIIVNNYYYDTVFIHLHDTSYVNGPGPDGVNALNVKIYTSREQIVVEGVGENMVTLYDAMGRTLATKQDYYNPLRFDVPASGTYMLKIGTHPARRVVVK